MNDELIRKMVEDTYDNSRENGVLWMAGDFYNKKMWSFAIFVWAWAVVFFAGAAYTGMRFFQTDQTKYQIMYVSIFVLCVEGIALMKIFATG